MPVVLKLQSVSELLGAVIWIFWPPLRPTEFDSMKVKPSSPSLHLYFNHPPRGWLKQRFLNRI